MVYVCEYYYYYYNNRVVWKKQKKKKTRRAKNIADELLRVNLRKTGKTVNYYGTAGGADGSCEHRHTEKRLKKNFFF